MERRKHFWNNRWGHMSRMDILLFEDGGIWWVEAREGGSEGKSRWFELPDQDMAEDCVRDLIVASEMDDWKELGI